MAAAANAKLMVGGASPEKLPEGQVNGDHLVPLVGLGCKCKVSFSVLISSAKPWRKKVLLVAAYRHAKVGWKRRVKPQEEEQGMGVAQHPEDVLQLVFSHLDLRSLAYAEMVMII